MTLKTNRALGMGKQKRAAREKKAGDEGSSGNQRWSHCDVSLSFMNGLRRSRREAGCTGIVETDEFAVVAGVTAAAPIVGPRLGRPVVGAVVAVVAVVGTAAAVAAVVAAAAAAVVHTATGVGVRFFLRTRSSAPLFSPPFLFLFLFRSPLPPLLLAPWAPTHFFSH